MREFKKHKLENFRFIISRRGIHDMTQVYSQLGSALIIE